MPPGSSRVPVEAMCRRPWVCGLLLVLLAGCRRPAPVEEVSREPSTVATAGHEEGSPTAGARVREGRGGSGAAGEQARTEEAAAAAGGAGCSARRPFVSPGDEPEKHLSLPAPFASYSACEVLAAIYPDYDLATERSAAVGGTVRADRAALVRYPEGLRIAVLTYQGEEAEQEMLCGGCSASARVALLAESAGRLAVVARGTETIDHGGYENSLQFAAPIAVSEGESLLLLDALHSGGTAPGRHVLHGFRLVGPELRRVLRWRSAAAGLGAGENRVEVSAIPTPTRGPKPLADLDFPWRRAVCLFDQKAGDFVCPAAKAIGTEKLRFDGQTYRLTGARVRVDFFD